MFPVAKKASSSFSFTKKRSTTLFRLHAISVPSHRLGLVGTDRRKDETFPGPETEAADAPSVWRPKDILWDQELYPLNLICELVTNCC